MADRLEEPDLVVLARVIDRGSFVRAAADLDVPPSTLSRRIAALERRLGVRALERTTRQLRPTEVGELLAARGRRVRLELEDAERVVADHRQTPRGVLRLAVPTPAAHDFLCPVLVDLLARYPELRVDVVVADNPLDLVAEGIDAALHAGAIQASRTFGVLRLGKISPVLAASARYVERAPPLRHPRDLADPAHTILASGRARRATWQFVHAKTGATFSLVRPTPRVRATSKTLVGQLVAAGLGIALIPRAAALAHGVTILEPGGYRPATGAFSLVTPSARPSSPKLRAFLDAMKAFIAAHPHLFS